MPMPGVKGGGGRGFLASEQELEVSQGPFRPTKTTPHCLQTGPDFV